MALLIKKPAVVMAVGNKPKLIREYVGRVVSKTKAASVAHMKSPAGWVEPGQRPRFDEYTLVLKGALRLETEAGIMDVKAGQAVIAPRGRWVRYSSPHKGGAEYIAVCVPAFSPQAARRDPS